MKVLCMVIDSGLDLTYGKWYEVLENNAVDYLIIDDADDAWYHLKDWFKTEADVRDDRLSELGVI